MDEGCGGCLEVCLSWLHKLFVGVGTGPGEGGIHELLLGAGESEGLERTGAW